MQYDKSMDKLPVDPNEMTHHERVSVAIARYGRDAATLSALAAELRLTEDEIVEAVAAHDYADFLRVAAGRRTLPADGDLHDAIEHDLALFLSIIDDDDLDDEDEDIDAGEAVEEALRFLGFEDEAE